MIKDVDFYTRIFGDDRGIIASKERMLESVTHTFSKIFSKGVYKGHRYLIFVPNRVELLGKHTDYQGGETLLLTGPKNFFALSALSKDGKTELIDANPAFGRSELTIRKEKPEFIIEGIGSNFTFTVMKRLLNNLSSSRIPPLQDVKSVFLGDIPFGGGTSGSSAKLISDFFIFATPQGYLSNPEFISLVTDNGIKANIKMGQKGVDDFILSLSMYLAHFENGLDFGDLRGDRGVGTFGGSEDHTAILLGEKGKLLLCRYCPTEVLERLDIWEDYAVVVAYSGRKAEKTREAMEKYNRLSLDASLCVKVLNEMNRTNYPFLRDFFQDLLLNERSDKAYEQLRKRDKNLAERAYQFFKEIEIIHRAVECIKTKDMVEYGSLINESHLLSKKYLKNIVSEVDYLHGSANKLGALGATGFGAGFGGSCYAVIHKSRSSELLEKWREDYIVNFPRYREDSRFDIYPACRGCFWERFNGI